MRNPFLLLLLFLSPGCFGQQAGSHKIIAGKIRGERIYSGTESITTPRVVEYYLLITKDSVIYSEVNKDSIGYRSMDQFSAARKHLDLSSQTISELDMGYISPTYWLLSIPTKDYKNMIVHMTYAGPAYTHRMLIAFLDLKFGTQTAAEAWYEQLKGVQ